MITRSIALGLLATVMVAGAAVNRTEAFVTGPATIDSAVQTDQTILNAAWVCGPSRCDWHPWLPNVVHREHSYSRNWGAPRTPGCFWEKRRGRWREKCPN